MFKIAPSPVLIASCFKIDFSVEFWAYFLLFHRILSFYRLPKLLDLLTRRLFWKLKMIFYPYNSKDHFWFCMSSWKFIFDASVQWSSISLTLTLVAFLRFIGFWKWSLQGEGEHVNEKSWICLSSYSSPLVFLYFGAQSGQIRFPLVWSSLFSPSEFLNAKYHGSTRIRWGSAFVRWKLENHDILNWL